MKTSGRLLLGALLVGGCSAAGAHTGHGAQGMLAGLAHPFGLDHLLAMVAVGVWSAVTFPTGRRAIGPATFMLGLLLGAAMAAAGLAWSMVDLGVAASVVLFGAMLAAPRALPWPVGVAMVGVAALLHGLAHGAELPPGASFVGYAAGFLATTAMLHGAGIRAGRVMARAHAWVWQATGAALGATGLLLMAQT
ncbi:MAG: HupE/UreJ family protein [Ideonella sp.]|nr:HupE/UreJ family protein [Ideonella sp.]